MRRASLALVVGLVSLPICQVTGMAELSISTEAVRDQLGKTGEDQGWIILPGTRLSWDGYSTVVIDEKNNRSMCVVVQDSPFSLEDSESAKVKADVKNEKDWIEEYSECFRLPFVQAIVSDYLKRCPAKEMYHAVSYVSDRGRHRAYLVEDSLFHSWARYLNIRMCPDEDIVDSARPLKQIDLNYIADVLKFSPGVRSAEKLFKAFRRFLFNKQGKSIQDQPKQRGKDEQPYPASFRDFENQISKLLVKFGVDAHDSQTLLDVLSASHRSKGIIFVPSEQDPQFLSWKEKALENKIDSEVIRLGGGECLPAEEEGDTDRIFAALPVNNPGEALVVLMHELGHAYDALKNGSLGTHGELWSLLFELATVMEHPQFFEAYLASPIFLSRSLQYPFFVLLEHILEGRSDVQRFLTLTAKDLLDAEDYNTWTELAFKILIKDQRTESVMKMVKKDPVLLEKTRLCFNTFFDGLVGRNAFFTEDFSEYATAFLKAFYVLTREDRKVVDWIELLNKGGVPFINIDLERLRRTAPKAPPLQRQAKVPPRFQVHKLPSPQKVLLRKKQAKNTSDKNKRMERYRAKDAGKGRKSTLHPSSY